MPMVHFRPTRPEPLDERSRTVDSLSKHWSFCRWLAWWLRFGLRLTRKEQIHQQAVPGPQRTMEHWRLAEG